MRATNVARVTHQSRARGKEKVPPPGRRRGPRTDINTREHIIDMAEMLFGQSSVDAVSLRTIAMKCGLATRAVAYHFPSKDELVTAVVAKRSGVIKTATAQRLSHLAETDEPVSVRDIVRAIIDPYVEMLDADPVDGLYWMKVVTQLASQHHEVWADQVSSDPDLISLFVAAALKGLPGLKTVEVQRRCGIAMMSMTLALAGSDLPAFGNPMRAAGIDRGWLEQLVEFTSGGLRGIQP